MAAAADKRARLAMAHWGAGEPEAGCDYYTFPPLVAFHSEAITGRPLPYSPAWLEDWICDTHLPPSVDRIVSLCCGFGELERILAQRGFFRECLAYDISQGAIEGAKRRADEAGLNHIRYEQADLNGMVLEPGSADVVWANGALHHIERLEHIVAEIHHTLRPRGTLVAVEYVGADHQRPTPRQHELINALIHLIPPRLRAPTPLLAGLYRYPVPPLAIAAMVQFLRGRAGEAPPAPTGRAGAIKRMLHAAGDASARLLPPNKLKFKPAWKYDQRYFEEVDPSEGVRASGIVPAVRRRFREAEVRYFHGTLLAYALDREFYRNFDPASAADNALLRSLVEIERQAIERGEIVSNNAVIIARKS
jgi:SAM-dependent methyltransferase